MPNYDPATRREAILKWKEGAAEFPITSQASFDLAISCFEQARKIDAEYFRSHGWLSYSYVTGVIDHWEFPESTAVTSADDALSKAQELAAEAVNGDPCDFDNHWAQGFVHLHCGDLAAAEDSFKEARILNFGNRELLAENADERVYAADYDKAVSLIMRARAVPDWQRWVLAWAYFFKARDKDDPLYLDMAIAELKQVVEEPNGKNKTPAEMLLLRAALHGQKSLHSESAAQKSEQTAKAHQNRENYESLRSGLKLNLADIEGTNPFKDVRDLHFLLDGLREAGFD